MSNQSKEALLQEAQELWDVLRSLRNDFEKGSGDFDARVYDVIAYIDAALALDPEFDEALAFKIQMMINELGAYEEAIEDAERLVQLVPSNAKYQEILRSVQNKLA